MKINIILILILIIFQIKAIEWCERNEINKEKKMEIQCYEESEINTMNCERIHFYIEKKGEKKKIIFDENVKREDVIISCDKEYDEYEFVFGMNENEVERNGIKY